MPALPEALFPNNQRVVWHKKARGIRLGSDLILSFRNK